jgi:hypothetical protein
VITFYGAPLDDGTGFVIHKCAHCHTAMLSTAPARGGYGAVSKS